MKELVSKTTVSYRWWRDGGKNILPSHVEELKENAEGRIADMREEDYSSGELCAEIEYRGKTVEYSGWWEVSSE
jgi:hypothetical protein